MDKENDMMDLTVDNLKKINAFTGAPVKKSITWQGANGKEYTATVYVRTLSYISAVSDIRSMAQNKDLLPGRIAACICDKDGKPVFKPEDITGEADPERGPLDENLGVALINVIAEVNGLGELKKK